MSTPFNIIGTLNLPPATGLPADPLPFGLSSQYDSKASFEYTLPASSGTKVVDFGTMPAAGVKAILVTFDGIPPGGGGDPPPITLVLNNSATAYEITSGGFLCFGSPKPVAGITAMTIAFTAAGKVKVWLLG